MRPLAFVLVLAAAARAEPTLAEALARIDRSAAGRVVSLAGRLDRLRQKAAAARLYERALVLDPDSAAARAKLRYRREGGEWTRATVDEVELTHLEDADPGKAFEMRDEATKVEEWRAREVVGACARYGTPAEARPILLALLERTPRLREVHEALGHERIGDRYVRSELAGFVRALGEREAAWRAAVTAEVDAAPSGKSLSVPGVTGKRRLHAVGGRLVTATYQDPWPLRFAQATEPPHRLMRVVLGEGTEQWVRSPLIFLSPENYTAMLRRLYPTEAERRRREQFTNYHHKDFCAVRVSSTPDAVDFYAHMVAYFTMRDLVRSPAAVDRDEISYAWIVEGFGFLSSLESAGTALSYFASTKESGQKIRYTLPPPEKKERDECHAWLRAQMEDGLGIPLREICGRSLNNLDFLASLQAYAFVRFLFLWDPEAARRLPAALQAEAEGTRIERSDRALRAAFGLGLEELAPLWHAYVLEVL